MARTFRRRKSKGGLYLTFLDKDKFSLNRYRLKDGLRGVRLKLKQIHNLDLSFLLAKMVQDMGEFCAPLLLSRS